MRLLPLALGYALLTAGRLAGQNLANLSALGPTTSTAPLTCGFVLGGTQPESILVRAIGPSLAGFGVAGALTHVVLNVYQGQTHTLVATNDTWGGTADLVAAFQRAGAFALPGASLDSAVAVTLPPGSYTAQATGAGGNSGNALVEIYDLGSSGFHLVNLSTLLPVGTSPVSVGFSLSGGTGIRRLLVRGVGPTLAGFGVQGALPDPAIAVVSSTGQVEAINNDWVTGISATGAFPLPAGSKDAALATDLPSGNYSVIPSANGGGSGLALMEIYDVTPAPDVVTVAATTPSADNTGNHPGAFTFTRTGDLTTALTVTYTPSGTSARGTGYLGLSGTATFPAGVSATTISVSPYPVASSVSTSTVTVTLARGTGYLAGDAGTATVTISSQAAGAAMVPPNFLLNVSPPVQAISQGAAARFTAGAIASPGFSDPVTLTVGGLPTGASATLAPGVLNESGLSAVTVTTSSGTPAGTYALTLTGTSATHPALTYTIPISLTVNGSASLQQAVQLVARMTLTEKIAQVHGSSSTNRSIPATANAPLYYFTNGPAGATNGGPGHQGAATAMPAPIGLAASFDPALAYLYGSVVGQESRAYSNDMMEGPDINLARVPQNGRTFEAFGEDPFLIGTIAVADIEGLQDQGINAESKHFAANNQETNRMTINEVIDERTLREIYLPAFEMTVKQAAVDCVMGAYNQINGVYCCENTPLLQSILQNEWGFSGYTTSDFGAMHSTVGSAQAGMDAEMPSAVYYGSALQTAVQSGQVPTASLDQMLIRRFRTMMDRGVYGTPPANTAIPTALDGLAARQIAEEDMVLLKNDGAVLPLAASKLHSIALIGPYATAAKTGGGGSSAVTPAYTVTPLDGLQSRAGPGVSVQLNDGSNLTKAAALAAASDVAIVMVGDSEAEGADDPLSLSGNQDALVAAVAAANPHTVVVLKSGTAILMPWAGSVPALLEAWYPGEEDGNAVAAVLFGDVNPSGKLPLTFPASLGDLPASTAAQYPGVNGVATYSEGIFVGYRHYDASSLTPLFPFGFGLSYTTFKYANLVITPPATSFTADPNATAQVDFDVTNTGPVAGSEAAQVYVGKPALPQGLVEPPRWLKGFQKVPLGPGQTGHIHLTLDYRAFAYWDVASHGWSVAPGTYTIWAAASSRDLRLSAPISLPVE